MLDINKNEEVDCATLMQRNAAMQERGASIEKGMSNVQFAKENRVFRRACFLVDIAATPRQAAKWRRGEGKVFLTFYADGPRS